MHRQLLSNLILAALVVLIYMTLWFIIALSEKRNDVADVAWGLGFVVVSSGLLYKSESIDTLSFLLICMVLIWGGRLALHIALRHKGKPEDKRYQAMRKSWKYKTLQSYLNVFLAQGVFMLLVSAPIIVFFSAKNSTFKWCNLVGLLIWLLGFLYEAISDYQLVKFIRNPKNNGKIMRYGLWKNTRHPNYFGEISLWWGIYLFTLTPKYWYLSLIGPVTITFLILGVSGIPMLEKRYKGNKEYEDYQKTTSAFFPLPNKKQAGLTD